MADDRAKWGPPPDLEETPQTTVPAYYTTLEHFDSQPTRAAAASVAAEPAVSVVGSGGGGLEPTKVVWEIDHQGVVEWCLAEGNEVRFKPYNAGNIVITPELLAAMSTAREHADSHYSGERSTG